MLRISYSNVGRTADPAARDLHDLRSCADLEVRPTGYCPPPVADLPLRCASKKSKIALMFGAATSP